MKTTKSPRKLLQAAYVAAQDVLRPYSHRFSPRKFTQHQLLACLVLKEFYKLDYRGVTQLLVDAPELQAVIELECVPHWTTLQKASDRLLKKTPHVESWIRRFASPRKRRSSARAPS
jgi:hypothetical protein